MVRASSLRGRMTHSDQGGHSMENKKRFVRARAGGTFGGGASAGATHNQNNVSMVWTGANQGLSFSLAHAGVNVRLTPEAQQQAARVRQNAAAARQEPSATPRTSQ